jgi:hypothetical protein
MPSLISIPALVVATLALLAACAPKVVSQATSFTPESGKSFRLSQEASIALSTGYSTKPKPGTSWELVGRVPDGEVYRTRDQIVTVEGEHIHEAYLVVSDGTLVGFYLPVERAFAPVTPARKLSIEP